MDDSFSSARVPFPEQNVLSAVSAAVTAAYSVDCSRLPLGARTETLHPLHAVACLRALHSTQEGVLRWLRRTSPRFL